MRAMPLIRQKTLQRCQQKRAKFSPQPIRAWVDLVLQKPSEELLGQILAISRTMAHAPNVSINRRPIGFTKLVQPFSSLGRVLGPRIENNRPMGGGEPACPLC